tara:strand:+ start:1460 stop:2476 length:1017 start_codon:yes stop_codon:yes gene_type:complete
LLEKKYLSLFLILFLLVFLVLASEILMPFLVGIILAYVLNPIVKKLDKIGLYHVISVILVLFLSLFLFFGSFIFLIPIFLDQLEIVVKNMPILLDNISIYIRNFNDNLNIIDENIYSDYFANFIESKSGQIFKYLLDFITLSLNKTLAFFNLLGLLLITPIVTFYILYDWDQIIENINFKFSSYLSKGLDKKITNINNVLSSFFRGQLIVNFILAIYYSFTLYIIGVEGSVSIGFLIGILSFIPYLGSLVGLLISLSFTIIQFGSFNFILLVLLVFILGQLLESYYLSPKFVSRSVGLHPLFSMFVIIAAGAAFGVIGILLAIPISAVMLTLLTDVKK